MADPSAPPRPHAPRDGRAVVRVRLGMYLAFLVIALAVLVQGRNTLELETVRSADAELLEDAGLQRMSAQQIGRLAAWLALSEPAQRAAPTQALEQALRRSADDALRTETVLARLLLQDGEGQAAVRQALERWQAARERLWYRAEILLRATDVDAPELLRRAADAVQAETGPAQESAMHLSRALRSGAEERARLLQRWLGLGMAALLVLLAVLSLVVVEPIVRAVRADRERLRRQAERLRGLALVAEHTSALVITTDRDDAIGWVNEAFVQATGWSLDEARGRRPGELLAHANVDDDVLGLVHAAQLRGERVRQEWLHQTRDGKDLWLDVDLCPLLDADGGRAGFVRVCSDVTARVQQQRKLQALWAALPAGVVVHGPDGEIVEANRAAGQLLGLSPAQLQGRDPMDPCWRAVREDGQPYPGEDHPAMRTLRSGLALRNETLGVHLPGGELRWLLVNTEPQRDQHGEPAGVVACFSDITQSRLLQDQLADNARTDALTRLPNRAVVMERLQRAIDHAARHPGYGFALLFMDFDRFKQINDTLGHAAGDELLRQIAQRLVRTVRPGDALARLSGDEETRVAARLGGDEFVVVLEGVSSIDVAGHLADRMLQELAEPYVVDANPLQSTASIGVVLCAGLAPDGRRPTPDELLRNADTAMYEAKRAGRGRWVLFDDSMHERVVRTMAIENDLRRALKEDELFVVYQPVLDLGTRAMAGVEALVRWRHPQRGLVSPADFIPVAEESGLIDALGQHVLHQSCRQFMAWQQTLGAAAPRQLAVNLSRAQLVHAGIVDDVRATLAEQGMQAGQLQLEVTESLAAQDERVQATLRELKSLGVRLALDDFGTGYSSLACLHQMPVDTVKVDRSFVQHAETVEYHRVLIEATIRVARTLGMTTVAEGIETEGQADLMLALDCDRGQGYLFSRPQEAEALEAWARERFEDTVDTL